MDTIGLSMRASSSYNLEKQGEVGKVSVEIETVLRGFVLYCGMRRSIRGSGRGGGGERYHLVRQS